MRLESSTRPQEIRLKQQTYVWQCLRLVVAIAVIFLAGTASAFQSPQTPAPGARKVAPRKTTPSGDKAQARLSGVGHASAHLRSGQAR